jgi:hypothetical protein
MEPWVGSHQWSKDTQQISEKQKKTNGSFVRAMATTALNFRE